MHCECGAQPIEKVNLERELEERKIECTRFDLHAYIMKRRLISAKGSDRSVMTLVPNQHSNSEMTTMNLKIGASVA